MKYANCVSTNFILRKEIIHTVNHVDKVHEYTYDNHFNKFK